MSMTSEKVNEYRTFGYLMHTFSELVQLTHSVKDIDYVCEISQQFS